MRLDGTFIDVEVDDAVGRRRGDRARSSTEVCPVDIFAADDGDARASSRRTSTSACSATCASTRRPPARCKVLKLYDGGAEL